MGFDTLPIFDILKRKNGLDHRNGAQNSIMVVFFFVWNFFANISKSILSQRLKYDPLIVFGLMKSMSNFDLDLWAHKDRKSEKRKRKKVMPK